MLLDRYQERAERAEADQEAVETQRRLAEERLRSLRPARPPRPHRVADGRQANGEVRATVQLLRSVDEPTLAPSPTIADIEQLSQGAARIGLTVDCRIAPDVGDVDALIGLTAYRIVQEALERGAPRRRQPCRRRDRARRPRVVLRRPRRRHDDGGRIGSGERRSRMASASPSPVASCAPSHGATAGSRSSPRSGTSRWAMIRVAIADDQTLVRSGFASLLDDVDDVRVVGEAADGEAAVRFAPAGANPTSS